MTETAETRRRQAEGDTTPPLSTEDIAQGRTPRVDRDGVSGAEDLSSARHEEEQRHRQETSKPAAEPKKEQRSPLFDRSTADELRDRWTEVQTGFVDEPRSSVEQADTLVAEVMQHLADSFATERKNLEGQWTRGDDVSTEDLRVAMQRYRSFFDRLLSI